MKKILTIALVLLAVLTLSIGLIGCAEDSSSNGQDNGGANNGSNNSVGNQTPPAHVHVYDKEVAISEYLVTEATCLQKATYNYSCSCGAKGTSTFEHGELGVHEYVNGVCDCNAVDESYIDERLFFTLINNGTEYEVNDYTGSASRLAIPKTYKNKPVTIIGFRAFYECNSLTSIVIGSGVTNIGEKAFRDCDSLTSIVFEENSQLTEIGSSAFEDCTSLTSIEIPNSVTRIGSFAFSDCTSLTSVAIPSSVTSIGENAFRDCDSLTSVVIGSGVTSIGDYAFRSCNSLTIYCEATSKPSGWESNWNSSDRPVYWYSETAPTTTGNYWHYVNGVVTKW